jgi:disulfide bond formation protein DsbB
MQLTLSPKKALAAAILFALAGFSTSLLLQHVGRLQPCELCFIQRWSVFATALFLVACLFSARPWLAASGRLGASLAALAGLSVAWRHVWIQAHPEAAAGCLPDFLTHTDSATSIGLAPGIREITNPFQPLTPPAPVSACSVVEAVKFGFSLAQWALAYAIALTMLVALVVLVTRRARAIR